MNHWHVIVEEGGKEPRRYVVRDRLPAEEEARREGQLDGLSDQLRRAIGHRSIRIALCDQPCLGPERGAKLEA